jgi:hypothetical protein
MQFIRRLPGYATGKPRSGQRANGGIVRAALLRH